MTRFLSLRSSLSGEGRGEWVSVLCPCVCGGRVTRLMAPSADSLATQRARRWRASGDSVTGEFRVSGLELSPLTLLTADWLSRAKLLPSPTVSAPCTALEPSPWARRDGGRYYTFRSYRIIDLSASPRLFVNFHRPLFSYLSTDRPFIWRCFSSPPSPPVTARRCAQRQHTTGPLTSRHRPASSSNGLSIL